MLTEEEKRLLKALEKPWWCMHDADLVEIEGRIMCTRCGMMGNWNREYAIFFPSL